MPSFGEASGKDWALMRCSTSLVVYELLDVLASRPTAKNAVPHLAVPIPDMIEAGLVEDDGTTLTITEAGRKFR